MKVKNEGQKRPAHDLLFNDKLVLGLKVKMQKELRE